MQHGLGPFLALHDRDGNLALVSAVDIQEVVLTTYTKLMPGKEPNQTVEITAITSRRGRRIHVRESVLDVMDMLLRLTPVEPLRPLTRDSGGRDFVDL